MINQKINKLLEYRASSLEETSSFIWQEIGNRLISKLEIIKLQPKIILDIGCQDFSFSIKLAKIFPEAKIYAADFFMQKDNKLSLDKTDCNNIETINISDLKTVMEYDSIDLIFSNCLIPYIDIELFFKNTYKYLAANSLILFSGYGPDTLENNLSYCNKQLQSNFIDMHTTGDILMKLKYLSPILETQHIKNIYKSSNKILSDISGISGDVCSDKELLYKNIDGLYQLNIELVLGHAWVSSNKPKIIEVNNY